MIKDHVVEIGLVAAVAVNLGLMVLLLHLSMKYGFFDVE